ncbi:hypothetical protein Tco_1555317, partial [Tanacetum coccineum]
MKTQNRKKSIAKKLKTNEDVQKQKETPSPLKETTTESTPTRRTKATAARGLHLQNTPPSENPPTTPQTETTNVQNTRILSPVIKNDSTQTPAAKAVEIKGKSGKNSMTKVVGGKKKAADEGAKKRKITEIESPGKRTRQSAKKQQVEKEEKEQVNKRKRDEKAKKEKVKKKMVKIKGKKKVEDDNEDFVVEEPHDEEDDNKKCEPEFKSLRARTTCNFIWDHIKTSKIGWDDRTLQNWYYSPNTVLMLIYLHYTKCDGMVMIPRKWPAIRNWTSQDAIDREIFEICQGKFGLVDVIEENEETRNESEVEKQKLKELIYETIEAKFETVLKEKRELKYMLKENIEMHELFYEDEKFELFVKKFKEEFTTGLNRDENQAGTRGARHGNGNDDVGYAGHCNDEDDVGHANDEDDDEAAEEKEANEATKKKEEAEKLAAANKKEAAKKSTKQAAKKNAKEAKEKAEKEAAEKAKREKIEAAKKNKQAAKKEKKRKKLKKKPRKRKKLKCGKLQQRKRNKQKCKQLQRQSVDVSEATTVPKSFESPKVQQKMFGKGQESTEKPKGKRITKPSVYLKSPFMNKMVKTQDKLDEDEILCARSVFCMQGDISEVVFDDGKGTIAYRKEMQSLAPGIEIEKQIIDTFVTVLNYEERIRTDGKDLRRRYFPTDAVLLNEDKDQAKQYESFENVIKNQMNASESKKKMKDVELAFFPTVVAAGQYYVIVFNLLKANA